MKTYCGARWRDGCHVVVGNAGVADYKPLAKRMDLRNHAERFDWGNYEPGCYQLALAILAEAIGDDLALEHYEKFHRDIISTLPREAFGMDEDMIWRWVQTGKWKINEKRDEKT